MNLVFDFARNMQTPSAHFEQSNKIAREILAELEAISRQDTLDMIAEKIAADERSDK